MTAHLGLQTYMRGTDCTLVPCHYEPKPNSITLIGRTQLEIIVTNRLCPAWISLPEYQDLWRKGEVVACYVGLPELNEVKKNGSDQTRGVHSHIRSPRIHSYDEQCNLSMGQGFSSMICCTSLYDLHATHDLICVVVLQATFTGILAKTTFLDKTDPKYANYDVKNFSEHSPDCQLSNYLLFPVELFILEMAKANFYYLNNTKEFGMEYVLDTIGTNRVSGAIASVTGSSDEKSGQYSLLPFKLTLTS